MKILMMLVTAMAVISLAGSGVCNTYELTTTTDLETYCPGDTVYIYGFLKENGEYLPGAEVEVNIPGECGYNEVVIVDQDGYYRTSYELGCDCLAGEYELTGNAVSYPATDSNVFGVLQYCPKAK